LSYGVAIGADFKPVPTFPDGARRHGLPANETVSEFVSSPDRATIEDAVYPCALTTSLSQREREVVRAFALRFRSFQGF
jgi:hypothetical protein